MNRADEMREIADRLLRLAEGNLPDVESEGGTVARIWPSKKPDPVYLLRLAKALVRARRLRESHFDADLFADPAWDMLLDLFMERGAGRRVAITSACIASHVPPTTALRWISLLENRGLVSREEDASDRRRAFVGLTRKGERAVARYLVAAGRHLRLTHPFLIVESQAS